ncbi:ABC transporter permease [Candidatus Mycoplasma pogonae]
MESRKKHKKYQENSANVVFSNKRSENYTIFQKLTNVNSPFFRIVLRLLSITVSFFVIAFIVITITFFLLNSIPGNPLTAGMDDATRQATEIKYGLDQPIGIRYLNYLKGLFSLDFGVSYSLFREQNINDFIWIRFLKSFYIGIFSVALTLLIGIPIGILIGKNPGGFLDNASTLLISFFSSFPTIVFGLVLIFLGRLVGLPFIFNEANFLTYIIPGLTISLGNIIVYIKYIRTELNRELNSVHAKFAYLKGVTKNSFSWKHALKPALFPIAAFLPVVIFGSFLGSLFVEKLFFIPGAGATLTEGIMSKDYNVVLFLIIIYSVITVMSFAIRDVLYELLDPRIRKKRK